MLISKAKIYLLIFSALLLLPSATYAGKLSEFNIVCGDTTKCNMATQKCYRCNYSSRVWWTFGAYRKTWTEYHCTSGNAPSGGSIDSCTDTSGAGGLTGNSENTLFGFTVSENTGYNCVPENYVNMYKICYSCVIVQTLISAFTKAGAGAYDVSRSLANVFLVIATVLWLSVYVLKSVSSFANVEPMKMIQDILVQLFKVMVAFVIVNAGISTILDYTMLPIMTTGTEFGNKITEVLGGGQ
jgi:hypothetical protein